jgi:hypothetical protein
VRRLPAELRWAAIVLCGMAGLPIPISFGVSAAEIDRGQVHWLPSADRWHEAGRPCILCGATRSIFALSHGDLAAARRSNRAGPILYGASWACAVAFLAAAVSACAAAWRRAKMRSVLRT